MKRIDLGYAVVLMGGKRLLFRRLGADRCNIWTPDPTQMAIYANQEKAEKKREKLLNYIDEQYHNLIRVLRITGSFIE